ncbi:kinase-like domain-containing protein [Bombardia bombarda]|uniref:Kinase-like domain-containing protein n=1 Tax=Bombardia bombarda TaxID=252184 RepID=A0AA40C225_9PEZI|nr:kinase-like domain-containing protein [Bombardia bombarda]
MSGKPGSGNPVRGKLDIICQTPTNFIIAVPETNNLVFKCQSLYTNNAVVAKTTFTNPGAIEYEAAIYERLGDHPRITKCYGVGEIAPNIKALILERSSIGCLREYTVKHLNDPHPPMAARLRMVQDFAEGVAHLHACGVIWCDTSPRNTLLFTEDWRLKLCDFGTAQFKDVVKDQYEPGKGMYEITYSLPPRGREGDKELPPMAEELFALGSAIFEITEWKMPYFEEGELIADTKYFHDELPEPSQDNPARDIIRKCWQEEYEAVVDVIRDLEVVRSSWPILSIQ